MRKSCNLCKPSLYVNCPDVLSVTIGRVSLNAEFTVVIIYSEHVSSKICGYKRSVAISGVRVRGVHCTFIQCL